MVESTSRLNGYIALPRESHRIVHTPTFLEGQFGKDFEAEYNGVVAREFENSPALRVIKNGKGSNPYTVTLANRIVSQIGLSVPTPAQIERIRENKSLPLQGFYIDTGLTLNGGGNPNSHLAKNLAKQLKHRGYNEFGIPILLPLAHLAPRKDSKSPSGLAFNLAENYRAIPAPVLISANNGKKFSRTDENGLPILDEKGDRTLYVGNDNSGIVRFYLGRGSDISSGYDGLQYSGDYGRVAFVGAEGASQNFSAEDLNRRYAEMQEDLRRTHEEKMSALENAFAEISGK